MASKMFFLSKETLDGINYLFQKGTDGSYIVINEKNGFADIAQLCLDYDNVRLVTVRSDRLDKRLQV